ncbi:MAG: helix-turn-helix domain-containing protein [Bacteroidales bacterium]|nr:helix-turn-helix domain-containing protein [Bacteroidales bacterium]
MRERACALYKEGRGYKSIAREMGLTRDQVRYWVQSEKQGPKEVVGKRQTDAETENHSEALTVLRDALKHRYRKIFVREKEDSLFPQETEFEKKLRKKKEKLEKKEEYYRKAREIYENGTESMLAVSDRLGLKYSAFRDFLQTYHPESRLLHIYNRHRKMVIEEIAVQTERIQASGDFVLRRMSEELEREITKIKIRNGFGKIERIERPDLGSDDR